METSCWECNKRMDIDVREKWIESKGNIRASTLKEAFNPPEEVWKRFYCEDCEQIVKERFEQEKQLYINLKIKMLFERAIRILETQKMDFYNYEEAIKAVKEFAEENPSKFDSSYEMIAAIILIQNRIMSKMQYKIGSYRVDFYLPDLKCVLEIDGERHTEKLLEDSNRDIKIRRALGAEWEIVRIPTEYLDQNAKMLPKAIVELKKLKQETRNKNGGIIPSTFSKRDKAKAKEVENIVKM